MKTMKQIALDAAAVLKEKGWVQGAYVSVAADGECHGFCAMGAIRAAAGLYTLDGQYADVPHGKQRADVSHAAWEVMRRVENFLYGGQAHGRSIGGWNDEPGRKKEEVIDLLTRAADQLPDELPAPHPDYV